MTRYFSDIRFHTQLLLMVVVNKTLNFNIILEFIYNSVIIPL